MDQIYQYVLGIAAAAMICGIVLSFAKKGPMEPLLKLICGLILTFTLIDPLLSLSSGNWEALGIQFKNEAEKAAEDGIEAAHISVRKIIKEETETYILDKAGELGLTVRVNVKLSDQELPVPISVTVQGTVPPYKKSKLMQVLEKELGIKKENQQWIS